MSNILDEMLRDPAEIAEQLRLHGLEPVRQCVNCAYHYLQCSENTLCSDHEFIRDFEARGGSLIHKQPLIKMQLETKIRRGEDVTQVDTSRITSMTGLFEGNHIRFNQDISGWDVSNVTDMRWMFANNAHFNQDISGWDVSNVDNMFEMFSGNTAFNQDLSAWELHPWAARMQAQMGGLHPRIFQGASYYPHYKEGMSWKQIFTRQRLEKLGAPKELLL